MFLMIQNELFYQIYIYIYVCVCVVCENICEYCHRHSAAVPMIIVYTHAKMLKRTKQKTHKC